MEVLWKFTQMSELALEEGMEMRLQCGGFLCPFLKQLAQRPSPTSYKASCKSIRNLLCHVFHATPYSWACSGLSSRENLCFLRNGVSSPTHVMASPCPPEVFVVVQLMGAVGSLALHLGMPDLGCWTSQWCRRYVAWAPTTDLLSSYTAPGGAQPYNSLLRIPGNVKLKTAVRPSFGILSCCSAHCDISLSIPFRHSSTAGLGEAESLLQQVYASSMCPD